MHDTYANLSDLVADVERLVRRLASTGKLGDSVEELERRMARLRRHWRACRRWAPRELRHRIRSTDRYVHDNPWTVLGIAAAAGFLIGAAVASRDPTIR